jgi:hypothetical protein
MALSAAAALLLAVTAAPAAAKNDNYHFIQHAASADFNHSSENDYVAGIHAAWYSPQSSFGGGVGPADPHVYVTYYGPKIGHDCEVNQNFYEFDYHWSMSRAYVGVDTPCGYMELMVSGEKGADPQKFTAGVTPNEATEVTFLLDGQPVPVALIGGGISRTSHVVRR